MLPAPGGFVRGSKDLVELREAMLLTIRPDVPSGTVPVETASEYLVGTEAEIKGLHSKLLGGVSHPWADRQSGANSVAIPQWMRRGLIRHVSENLRFGLGTCQIGQP